MEALKYRKRARIVGWIDLVILILCMLWFILFVIVLAPSTVLFIQNDSKFFHDILASYGVQNVSSPMSEVKHVLTYYWVSATFDSIFTGVQIVTAVLLVNSANLTRNPRSSLKFVTLWLVVNVSIILIYFVWRIIDHYWFTFVLGLVIRLGFTFVVVMYFRELRKVVNASGQGKSKSGGGGGGGGGSTPISVIKERKVTSPKSPPRWDEDLTIKH